jgi:hypothetical protein
LPIEQTNLIDAAGLDGQTGDAVLTLLDALAWDDPESHLRLLDAKLDAYLTFVESGEVFEAYPAAQGRSIRIDVIFRFGLHTDAVALLKRAENAARDLSVRLTWHVRPG